MCGNFWQPLSSAAQKTAGISVREVIDVLDAVLEPHLFPPTVRARNCTALPSAYLLHISCHAGTYLHIVHCMLKPLGTQFRSSSQLRENERSPAALP